MKRRQLLRIIVVALAASSICSVALAAGEELLINGLLTQGTDGKPVGWRYQSYFPDPAAEQYSWNVDASGIGTLKIVHLRESDSRWIQNFRVSPRTWYHVSGWIRVEHIVPPNAIGAHISIAENGYSSEDLRGTVDWRQVGFWMKTTADQKSAELECRLGSFSSANTGTAYFTAISVAEGAPPQEVERAYGGNVWDAPSQRRILIWLLTVIGGYAAALLFWRLLAPPSGRIPR